jgi:hypothetical protein
MPKALGSIPRIDFPQKLFQFKILAESYIFWGTMYHSVLIIVIPDMWNIISPFLNYFGS